MAHSHNVFDSDTHFTINPASRVITNTTTKAKLIQGDHDSESFAFKIPRYIEGHDMMLCDKVEVHYINVSADKKEQCADVYHVDDMQISPDDENSVIFSWLISRNATKYAGTLNFLISFKCLTGEVIEYAWNTDIYKAIEVKEGINNSETVIADYTDVLEAWKLEAEEAWKSAEEVAKTSAEAAAKSAENAEAAAEELRTMLANVVFAEGVYFG